MLNHFNTTHQAKKAISGTLYIVATPIGNLADITKRAIEILGQVDLIAAEDTRHSKKLLEYLNIAKPLYALHGHNEQSSTDNILKKLRAGENIALISDAGTPLISDPGFKLVKLAREQHITVTPIPGACALITALCAAGLPTNNFIFEGFLPTKTVARKNRLKELVAEERTLIFYEAPHRIIATIKDMQEIFGNTRYVVIARELTKKFETIHGAVLEDVIEWLETDKNQQKGEFVIIAQGSPKDSSQKISSQTKNILKILLAELTTKQAIELTAKITGEKKNRLKNIVMHK